MTADPTQTPHGDPAYATVIHFADMTGARSGAVCVAYAGPRRDEADLAALVLANRAGPHYAGADPLRLDRVIVVDRTRPAPRLAAVYRPHAAGAEYDGLGPVDEADGRLIDSMIEAAALLRWQAIRD